MRGCRIELQGARNFRDIGGCATVSGTRVAAGRVYRSDALHRLTPDDAAVLERLGITRVVDLRSGAEVTKEGVGDFAGARHLHVPLVEVSLSPYDPSLDWERIDLEDRYVEMLATGGRAIRAVLESAAEPGACVVFHCTAGKDRTGVVAAVLLRALGVCDEDVVADYAASEVHLRDVFERWRAELASKRLPPDAVAYLTSSPPRRMRRMLAELDRRWGSTQAYLAAIGVDAERLEALRASLLR